MLARKFKLTAAHPCFVHVYYAQLYFAKKLEHGRRQIMHAGMQQVGRSKNRRSNEAIGSQLGFLAEDAGTYACTALY